MSTAAGASNYGDDFRSVAGDDLGLLLAIACRVEEVVVGGDSSDVGSTETRLRSDSAEEWTTRTCWRSLGHLKGLNG